MTTFDGSTISLSLSPIMTPSREGDAPFNIRQEKLDFVCEKPRRLSTASILFPSSACRQTRSPTGRTTSRSWMRIWAWRSPSWAWAPARRWRSASLPRRRRGRLPPRRARTSPPRRRRRSSARRRSWRRARKRRKRKKKRKPKGLYFLFFFLSFAINTFSIVLSFFKLL